MPGARPSARELSRPSLRLNTVHRIGSLDCRGSGVFGNSAVSKFFVPWKSARQRREPGSWEINRTWARPREIGPRLSQNARSGRRARPRDCFRLLSGGFLGGLRQDSLKSRTGLRERAMFDPPRLSAVRGAGPDAVLRNRAAPHSDQARRQVTRREASALLARTAWRILL